MAKKSPTGSLPPAVPLAITPTSRPWTHTCDDSYFYQLSLVLATATVSFAQFWPWPALRVNTTCRYSPRVRASSWRRSRKRFSTSAPNHVIGKYPFDDLWVHPPNPTMLKTLDLEDHHLRSVFVWIPEFTFPDAFPEGRPPCPRCKTTYRVIAKGFTQKESRRAILRSSCCDLLGYFYHCHGCKSNNQGLGEGKTSVQ